MTSTVPIRVLLVDDDPLVRGGLSMMLSGSPALSVVGEADDGAAGIEAVATLAPDVVLMDIRMPGMDGLAAIEALQARGATSQVIVLTTFDADDQVVRALRAGAAGFLLKDTPPADIVRAIERVAAGEPMLSPAIIQRLISQVTDNPAVERRRRAAESLAELTEREHDVAMAVAEGKSNAEIGEELHLSVASVKAVVSRVLAKLDASNRVQVALLVRDAEEAG
ncbi:MAG: response regulator transcription factor [Solirubrobacteraceae bacterium]|nr:response regulator transcription factor [Solirubrobacteraceae bacterium]